ncbi:MAG: DUF3842 family protein [Lachnospiraceae bacterium]|nr:DUF3842 family protein [Lachnospiraceae bacterium]
MKGRRIVVIDGQGGNIGRQLVKMILERFPDAELTAVGTNSTATENMLKAGAKNAATGENAAAVACRKADVIVGPIGIVITDALLGEVTAKIASAVGAADAVRILIPMNRCDTLVAGVSGGSPSAYLADAMEKLEGILKEA